MVIEKYVLKKEKKKKTYNKDSRRDTNPHLSWASDEKKKREKVKIEKRKKSQN